MTKSETTLKSITLPPALIQRIERHKRIQDRAIRWATYALLKKAAVVFGLPEDVLHSIDYSATGRPYFPAYPSFDFNLSHSGEMAVCAAVSDGRVGVDVEQIQPINFDDTRAAFSESVWREIEASDDPQREIYRAWTRLEAVAKGEGFGIAGPVCSIQFEKDRALYDGREWHLLEIPIATDYVCHVASTRQISLADVQDLTLMT